MPSPLEYTPLEEIPVRVQKLQKAFQTRKFDSVEKRLDSLRNIYYCLKDNEDLLIKALVKDLNKPRADIEILELAPIYSDLLMIMGNLRQWVKSKKPSGIPLLFKFSNTRVEYIPLGTVLVIGAYNYPLILTLQAVVGAVAAGNNVVIKQSEQVPYTSATLTEILTEAIDNELIQCIDGGVDETTTLLNQKFDKVIYTGSGNVGKIIARKCAETLTPCILELGGKSPAFITSKCSNLDMAAKRIVYVKFTNAGQICVTVDYALVEREIYHQFLEYVLKWVKKLYGEVTPQTYTKIVNTKNTQRIADLIQSSKGELIYGGKFEVDQRYIQPTIIKDVSFDDPLMKDEIFGPVLPIIPYDSLNDAITQVIEHHDTPLSLYAYTDSSKEADLIKGRIRSGAFSVNESMVHVGDSSLPFGGVGSSGNGNYHGYASFKAFSHERATLKQPFWIEPLFEAKYPPTTAFELIVAKSAMVPPALFGRTGPIRDWATIARNLAIALFLLTGLYLGFTSKKEDKFFALK